MRKANVDVRLKLVKRPLPRIKGSARAKAAFYQGNPCLVLQVRGAEVQILRPYIDGTGNRAFYTQMVPRVGVRGKHGRFV